MRLTDSEQEAVDKLSNLLDSILLSLDKDFNRGANSYPDLVKVRNILQSRNFPAMSVIRKRLRSGFRMVDESVRVSDELNRKINGAYEITMMNRISMFPDHRPRPGRYRW